jgi:serine protease
MGFKRVVSLLLFFTLIQSAFSQIAGLKGKSLYFKMPASVQIGDYLERHVIFKVNGAGKSLIQNNIVSHSDLTKMLAIIDGKQIRKFPKHYPSDFAPHGFVTNPNEKAVDLSLIFEIEYQGNFSVEAVINQLYSLGIVEYAEPLYIPKLLYNINDPLAFNAYYLDMVQAYAAWDVQKGDTNIVIGIVDTGVDFLHPDIAANIKHNYNDPIDGIDNDLDGKIDNFNGWDLGENDNDPTPTAGGYHGLWVAGCAAAVPNNNSMGAGVGFNTKVMPIKITNASGYLTAAYDGIVYAADHGCKVINASWGSSGAYSMYNQEIINYAAINKGCVIVAAAGNDNNQGLFYPASYDNVVSVGGTEQNDQKWFFSSTNGSNFNESVDLCAPSKAIWTTYQGNTYIKIGGGTSFASPQVAAAAALVWAQYPSYNASQVVARLKSTTDDLYAIPFNQTYQDQLGTGRLNVYNALTQPASPFVGPVKIYSNDGVMAAGDTISFWIDLQNFISTATAVTAKISTKNADVVILDSIANYGGFGTLESKQGDVPYRMVVSNMASTNDIVSFKVTITDGAHTWKENISINVNRDYIDIEKNLIQTSITNLGTVGYNYGKQGNGFRYNNSSSSIYEMGLVVATDSIRLSSAREFDFNSTFKIKTKSNGESDFDVESTFNDDYAGSDKLNIEITQKCLSWNSAGNNKYVIIEYCIKNKSGADLNNVLAGMYTDFDIIDRTTNKAGYLSSKRLGYAYRDGSAYYGVQMLSNETPFYYAFNNDGSAGSINTLDGFSSAEQYMSMNGGLARTTANYGDISTMIGVGALTIAKDDSIWVTFALVAGDNLADITNSATNALAKYKELRSVKVGLDFLSDINCHGANDGKISLTVSNGIQPYKITWTNLPGVTTPTVSGLSKGTYQARIKDKLNFEVFQTFTINEPAALQVNKVAVTNVSCFGKKTGEVDYNISGGTPSYYFNWNNPAIASVEKPGLPAGKHHLVISDANGCTFLDTIEIKQPNLLSAVISSIDDSTGNAKGSAEVAVSGGVFPYTYLWNDNKISTDSAVVGLSAGSYTVNIMDANSCSLIKTASVKNLANKNEVFTYSASSSLKAFPNPASSYFILEFELDKGGIIDLSMYDEGGKQVKKIISGQYYAGAYKVLVYTDDLSNGFYFYALKEETTGSSGKLSVVK